MEEKLIAALIALCAVGMLSAGVFGRPHYTTPPAQLATSVARRAVARAVHKADIAQIVSRVEAREEARQAAHEAALTEVWSTAPSEGGKDQ